MATIILVHGAFQGGWVWERVAPALRSEGCKLFCPTLSGDLPQHIASVCRLIGDHDLSDVILFGHSFGGIVIEGAASHVPNKIQKLIYLDAPIAENGQSLLDVLGEEARSHFLNLAYETGEGKMVDSLPAEAFGLERPEDIEWAMPQHRAQSLKSFTDPVIVQAHGIRHTYIHCTGAHPFSALQATRAKQKGWSCYELDTPHSPMITHPDLFLALVDNKLI